MKHGSFAVKIGMSELFKVALSVYLRLGGGDFEHRCAQCNVYPADIVQLRIEGIFEAFTVARE
jgi:hypothetical protein